MERQAIVDALTNTGGNKVNAAKLLGIGCAPFTARSTDGGSEQKKPDAFGNPAHTGKTCRYPKITPAEPACIVVTCKFLST